ncbi:MAG: hypothetical protein QOF16_1154 [Actinomycetota bacterium]|jgi:acyl-CoA synthetase (AMP-forming)/AMP-acid ligase II|nr:hypothetical protein [Actinomycetota bacterium]MEA2487500.1 hypothetical protein [Actinomycetota bacterium]
MIFRSPAATVSYEFQPLGHLILQQARARGDKPALIDAASDRTITYSELGDAIDSLAAGLHARGFSKGDVFGIFLPNVPEYAVVYHAVARLGGASTTVNPLYTADELEFQLNDAGAKYLLTIPQFLDRALEAAGKSAVKEVFVLGEAEGATPLSDVFVPGGELPNVEITSDDVIALPYSSGTTGLPKGVMLTHGNLVANIFQTDPVFATDETQTLIAVLPFFHIFGQQVIMNSGLSRGATVVSLPRFDLEQFLGAIQKYRVTRAYLVPPIILALAKHPVVEKYDVSSLQLIVSGAAPLGREVQETVEKRLGCKVVQGYGLTETGPVTNVSPQHGATKFGSIGPLVPNTEAKVIDVSTGDELDPDERGEICIRGPQIMKGYLNNTAATEHTIDGDGFLHTGDIGYVDDEGDFYIVDRLKELIKFKGFQVPPAELEALLLTHPSIADAAVIPVPDEEAGELPKAYVVKTGDLTEDDVMSYVAERVAPYKKVRLVEFVDEIPKSASGKILRRVLVERERAATTS